MSNFDDIFETQATTPPEKEAFDKEKWAEGKQSERQAVYELADATAEAVCTDGSKFREYLDVQAKFDRYSAPNALLIFAQMPQATQIKDFDSWKEKGISIKKQQKGISILVPGDEYTGEDGKQHTPYNVKKVFDISQTTEKSKEQPTIKIDERAIISALISGNRKDIIPVDNIENRAGGAFFNPENGNIHVRRGLEFQDLFRALSVEIAHKELASVAGDNYSRENMGFNAYCASYIVCKKNDIDVKAYNFSKLPNNLKDGDSKSLRAQLSTIRDTAEIITTRMAKSYEQTKETRHREQER